MRFVVFSCLFLLVVSCENHDFKALSSCAHEKLIRFGEGTLEIENSQVLELHYVVSRGDDHFMNSVFLKDYEMDVFGSEVFCSAVQKRVSGDSLHYSLCYKEIKGLVLDEFSRGGVLVHDSDVVELKLGVGMCLTLDAYSAYKAEQVQKGLLREMELIDKYIMENNLQKKLVRKGDLYYMKLKDYGKEKVRVGDGISLAYTCSFLDGRVFDEVTSDDPLIVRLGTPDQVVLGFESVLKELGEKEEAMVIIPSYLAFGEDGSSDGRVPEKTPIVINVTVLEKLN